MYCCWKLQPSSFNLPPITWLLMHHDSLANCVLQTRKCGAIDGCRRLSAATVPEGMNKKMDGWRDNQGLWWGITSDESCLCLAGFRRHQQHRGSEAKFLKNQVETMTLSTYQTTQRLCLPLYQSAWLLRSSILSYWRSPGKERVVQETHYISGEDRRCCKARTAGKWISMFSR